MTRFLRHASVALAFALSLALAGCKGCSKGQAQLLGSDLPPIPSAGETANVPVPGFGEAVVVAPRGATKPAPLLVAVLGIGDTPEEQCAVWRELADKAFVLCPRGAPNMVSPQEEDAGFDESLARGVASAGAVANGAAAATPSATGASEESALPRGASAEPEGVVGEPRTAEGSTEGTRASADESASADGERLRGEAAVPTPKNAAAGVKAGLGRVASGSEARGPSAAGAGIPGASASGSEARGPKRQVGFYPVDVPTLERELETGIAAVRVKYGGNVTPGPIVYVGFSRGAFLGATIAAKHPELYPRVVLIEGGHSPWTDETAASFARGGGKRVLFVCGQPSCASDAEAAVAILRRHGVESRVLHGAGEGHGYKRQVKDELSRAFRSVVEDDERWR